MRPEPRIRQVHAARAMRAGMPAAVAGSIALLLSPAPAQALPTAEERMPRPLAVDRRHAVALTVGAPALRALPSSAAAPATYTVVRGDTVSAIAARFGLRTADVLAINGLTWKSVIFPGQVLRLTGGAPAAPPAASAPSRATGSYVVRGGDTVSAIAERHGVPVQSVLSANGLGWSSVIHPGQQLVIPGRAVPAAATQPAPAPAPAAASHTVRAGDTVTAIAQRHGLSVNAVLAANGLTSSSIIYPGQTLTIPAAAGAADATGLDAEQTENARMIIRIGRELGVPDRGIAIALGTAMQESWIRNLDWGDRDSLGLFQQRPSTGWGTAAQVRDRERAIRAFYGGPGDPNGSHTRGLLDIPGWQGMSFADAAQAVQVSAYPDRYARWEKPAFAWLAALG